jgi:hypothetical protein
MLPAAHTLAEAQGVVPSVDTRIMWERLMTLVGRFAGRTHPPTDVRLLLEPRPALRAMSIEGQHPRWSMTPDEMDRRRRETLHREGETA